MKKSICAIALSVFSIALFTACGAGEEPAVESQVVQVTPEEVRPQGEVAILNYEVKYQSGTFTMEDYRELAVLYEEQGFFRKQRDMLEQSFRLYGEAEDFETLQKIYVNLAEEEADVLAEAELMLQNLETPGYFAESIHQLGTEEWFDTLMPKMKEGVRNYYLEQDGERKLVIRVGYETADTASEGAESTGEQEKKPVPYSLVWYHGEEDKLTLIARKGGVVQVLEAGYENQAYNGGFTLWLLDGSSGSIVKETGNFHEGIYAGEYTVDIYQGQAAGDPYDLWNNREAMEYTTYSDEADSEGVGQLEQFAIHLPAYPEFVSYEVKEDLEGSVLGDVEKAPKMRVFDGELQWFDGTYWVSIGKVEQLEKEDPFYMYAKQDESLIQEEIADSGLDLGNISTPDPENEKEPETKPETKPENKPSTTAKPSTTTKPNTSQTTTPQGTQKPAVTPPAQTTPPATVTPPENDRDEEDDDDDAGDSDSGDNSGSDDSGSDGGSEDSGDDGGSDDSGDSGSDGGSDDGGSDDSGDDDSNDADVEWSEDIM